MSANHTQEAQVTSSSSTQVAPISNQQQATGQTSRRQAIMAPAQPARASPTPATPSFSVIQVSLVLFAVALLGQPDCTSAFHLSFGHRLLRTRQAHTALVNSQMQLNPASTLIRPIECRNANNHSEAGICMFSIDCMQNKGSPLSICKHNYFVGTCCKLPDHNNFVGIVYDLRETETSSAAAAAALAATLAARKDAPAQPPLAQVLATATEQPAGQTFAVHSWPAANVSLRDTEQPAEGSPVLVPAGAVSVSESLALTTRSLQSSALPEAPPSTAQWSIGNGNQASSSSQLLDEKYMISSTSLFGVGSTAASLSPSTTSSPVAASQASESARNVDGSVESAINAVPPLDANGLKPTSGDKLADTQTENKTMSIAYELLRDELSQLQQSTSTNNITLENHSSVSSTTTPSSTTATQQTTTTTTTTTLSQSPASAAIDEQKATIVFANNHGPSSSSGAHWPTSSTLASSSESTQAALASSSQEFALAQSVTEQPAAAVASASAANITIASTSSSPSASSIGSPLYDLISLMPPISSGPTAASSQLDVQTSTPFTSSLSTALLPNVSSHAYAPTTPTTAQADQSTGDSKQTTITTTTTLVSQPNSQSAPSAGNATGSAAAPEPIKQQHQSAAQFYSGQQQQQQQAGKPSGLFGALGGGLPPASSKIVAGASPMGPNNLIPGLSGLQSAILSHIPFKIASGLSSGLSSYLQAAMKPAQPNQSANQRPLISSNTAPALQYQPGATRAPVAAQSSASGSAGASLPVASASTSGHASQPSSSAQAALAAPSLTASAASAGVLGTRDVLREAQLVCGRPQVAPLGEFSANKRRVARIVGGNQSLFGQWPWMVSLRQWRKGAFLHKCGAALLNENWAITAAHCVENVKVPDLLLRLGEFDVSNQNEPFPYIERRVKTVVSHPAFDPKTFEYDLALLRFSEPIQYERNIIPVCVPNGNDSYVDRIATVIGWGRLYEDGPLPDIIQHVDVPIIANDECEKMYKSAGYVEEIPDMFICAGINKGGRDSCEGDSGGPLTMVDYDGRSYLVGIISWGIGCALPSQPGVYTRITAFSDWINQITGT